MTRILSVDIETTGLDFCRDKITCIGAVAEGVEAVLRDASMPMLQKLEGDIVGHNFKFDAKFLLKAGINAVDRWTHDTKLMAHICSLKVPDSYLEWYEQLRKEENKKLPLGVTHRDAGRLSLKVLAPYFLKVEPFWENPANHDDDEYVIKDCTYTLQLFEFFKERLIAEGSWDFYLEQMNKEKMLLRMELRGIALDEEQLDATEKEYKALRDKYYHDVRVMWAEQTTQYTKQLEQEVQEKYAIMAEAAKQKAKKPTEESLAKIDARYETLSKAAMNRIEPFNLASSAQVGWLLQKRGYNITDKDGKSSTKKSNLNRLAKEGKEDVKAFLNWRDAEKVLTMYLPTYRELQYNGVIHPTFNSTGTRTGRLSSSGPNMQQVPSKLYKLFKPRPGYLFAQHDLAGIEAALITLYSGDKNLYDILQRGESIHDYNAINFFDLKVSPAEVAKKYPKERRTAKTIGFALFYGAGYYRIKEAFLQNGFVISDKEAKDKLKKFREFFSGAAAFHKEITEVFESGEVVENLFGRPIKIQAWENPFMNGFNTLIQSSASDLNVRAAEKANDKWKRLRLDAHPLLLVHDFILAEVSEKDAEQADKILVDCMTGFNLQSEHGKIQLKVDGGISNAWKK